MSYTHESLTRKFQDLYNMYIENANRYYDNSQNPTLKNFDVAMEWLGNAKTSEWDAHLLDLSCAGVGIFLKTKPTKREIDIEKESKDEATGVNEDTRAQLTQKNN